MKMKPIKFDKDYSGRNAISIFPEVKHFTNFYWDKIHFIEGKIYRIQTLFGEKNLKEEVLVCSVGLFTIRKTEVKFKQADIEKISVFEQYNDNNKGQKVVEIEFSSGCSIRIEKFNNNESISVTIRAQDVYEKNNFTI